MRQRNNTVREKRVRSERPQKSAIKEFLFSAALQKLSKVRFFIEQDGMDPNATFDGKPTAICYAALKQDFCLMRYLIRSGADVNSVDVMGMTPLHYAALGGCKTCISFLVHNGARVNVINKSGKTPLHLVLDCPHLQISKDTLIHHGGSILPACPGEHNLH